MKNTLSVGMVLALLVMGCASSEKKKLAEVHQDMATISDAPRSPKELYHFAIKTIDEGKTLTVEQKTKLKTLATETHENNNTLRSDISKMKTLLVEEVIASKPDTKKIKLLKKEIRNKNSKVLDNIYNALDSAKATVQTKDGLTLEHQHMIRLMIFDPNFHQ